MIQKQWNPDRITDQLQLTAIQKRRPLSCTMELTYRCNFRCRMCYIRMTDAQAAPYGRMRTVEEWLDMAGQLRDAGVLYLTLTGGECTQYPGFEQLYEQLSLMGFKINIMSNAGAYSESIHMVFRQYPPASVGITLYGGSNETYGEVTGDPKGFEKVLNNIRFFQSLGIPIGLNYTIIQQNVRDYPKISGICQTLEIPYTLITDISSHHYDEGYSNAMVCRLSPAERVCLACHPPKEIDEAMTKAKELEKELVLFRTPKMVSDSRLEQKDSCIGAYTGCAIYWNGEMQTCISLRNYRCVKPFETGFESAWAQLKAEQEETFLRPGKCQACEMAAECLHNCAGRRMEGTGSPHEPDPYTCQYTYLMRKYKPQKSVADVPGNPQCV